MSQIESLEETKSEEPFYLGRLVVAILLIGLTIFGILNIAGTLKNAHINAQYPVTVIDDDPKSLWTKYSTGWKESFSGDIQLLDGTRKTVVVQGWKNGEDGVIASPTLVDVPTRAEYVSSLVKEKYGYNLLNKDDSLDWLNTAKPIEGSYKVMTTEANGKESTYYLSVSGATMEPILEESAPVPIKVK